MKEIDSFVQEARKKNLDDTTIRSALIEKGWDTSAVDLALSGLKAPEPIASMTPPPHHQEALSHGHETRPSLNPLLAALHHVILWFFTVSSAVTIGGAVATLYGSDLDSAALASMIAVTLITFIPYAILFGIFLKKTRTNPMLIPGKVWSIITICLHSIGAMIAAIVAVIAAITSGDMRVLVSALLILTLDLLVVAVYALAAFSDGKHALRKVLMIAYLPLLIILFGTLFGLSVFKLGPIKHDEQVRKDLAQTVQNVAKYTENSKKLPENATQAGAIAGVEYRKVSADTYEVCASFQTGAGYTSDTGRYYGTQNISDDYVYDDVFINKDSGRQCFSIASYALRNQQVEIDPAFPH